MIKNTAGQSIGAQMINATSGAAFVSPVTVYITGDAGTQAIGSVGAGVCTHEGNGYHTYRPSQDETNYDLIAFTFIGTGAIPYTVQIETITASQQAAVSASSVAGSFTVRDWINRSARLAGILAPGETLSGVDMQDALDIASALLDAWAADRLLVYTQSRTENTIVGGTQRYTLGTGGAWNQDQPLWLDYATYKTSDGQEYPLRVFSRSEWADVSPKNFTSSVPEGIFVNPGAITSDVDIWPVPTDASIKIVLYVPSTPLSSASSLDTVLSLRRGWSRALRYNLALELADEFGTTPKDRVSQIAVDSLAEIRRQGVTTDVELEIDPALASGVSAWSITRGDFVNH